MKIRQQFISNSSSSSFIATIAFITDEEKFKKFEETVGYTYDRLNYEQICKDYHHGDFFDCLSKPDAKYSDCTFVHAYDIDIDECNFFDEVLALNAISEEDGAKIICETFYAGRNG